MEPLATQENINQQKSKINREVFLIIILAVVLILVNGYFFYKQYSAPSQVVNQELVSEIENMSEWKTYRNEEYGFELKHPSYYKPVIIYKNLASNELFRVDFVAEPLTTESPSPSISLAIWNNNKKLSLIDWANSNRDFSNYGDGYFNVNFNKKIIYQNNAISYEWEVGEYGKTILIENKTNIFVISTSNIGQIDILKDLDNISETIKFFSVDGSVLLKQCPEEWIDNQMPGIRDVNDSNQTNRQYFILNGERREMTEFDIDWVNKNCKLEKQTVY